MNAGSFSRRGTCSYRNGEVQRPAAEGSCHGPGGDSLTSGKEAEEDTRLPISLEGQ